MSDRWSPSGRAATLAVMPPAFADGTATPGRRLVAALVVLLLAATGCWSGTTTGEDLQVVSGGVERQVDDEWVPATSVAEGQLVRTTEPTLLTDGAQDVWLDQGTEVVLADGEVALRRGSAVVDGDVLAVRVGDAVVDGVGAFRVDAGVTPRVGVYQGTAEVRRPGEGWRLAPLRQVSLTSRRFDGTDDPLDYDAADGADQRYLAKAIAFDAEVARYATRLAELYGTVLQPPSFYAAFAEVAPEEVAVLTQAAPARDTGGNVGPPAEALIGLFVARALAQQDGLALPEASDRVARLREEGARWGLIAMALDLGELTFGATVDQAVAAATDVVAVSAPVEVPDAGGAPAAPGPGSPPPDPTTPVPPAGPPPTIPQPPPSDAPGLLDPVTELLGEVLDVLPVEEALDGVGGLLGEG